MKKVLFTLALVAMMLPLSAQTPLFTESFDDETSLTGWTITPDSSFIHYATFGNLGNGCLLGIDSGSATMPVISVPADADGLKFVCYVYGEAQYANYGLAGIYSIVASTATITDTIAADYAYTPYGFVRVEYLLDAFAGQDVTIQFGFENDMLGASVLVIDDIKVGTTNAPLYQISGPATVITNADYTFSAIHIEGDTANNAMSFVWSSLLGTVTPNGETATVNYTTAGNDIITLIATNSYDSYTATFPVTVVSCTNITEADFPWTESFENADANCWQFVSNTTSDEDNFRILNNYAHSGEYCLFGPYNETASPDVMAISRAIEIPANASGLILSWYVKGGAWGTANGRYSVLVSTTGTALADFTSVYNQTITSTDDEYSGYVKHSVSLADYANQTIYIAFRNQTDADGNSLMIDDVEIRYAQAPVFTVSGPTSVDAGVPATFTATYVEGDETGMTYNWTSNLGTITDANTTTATITYAAAGNDVVTFTATNNHGTFTATLDVTVVSCDPITEFPWNEDFEQANVYDCWKFFDEDGDGYNWNTDYLRDFVDDETGMPNPQGHNGSNGMVASASYMRAALTPDNWMVLPTMTLPENSNFTLSWYEKGQDADWAAENYSVYISTTGNNVADFTTAAGNYTATADWTNRTISLNQYAGQTIYIAFRHHDITDMFWLDIDDITVGGSTTGIEGAEDANVAIFPNPVFNMLNIEGNNVKSVEIIDMNGRVVINNNRAGQIDMSELSEGVYMVRVMSETGVSTKKIVKK